jgi:CHAT domain-containing protein/Tfp pilus assembly protein PilF
MRALLCGLLLAGVALGAAPPARLTPEQVKLLRERPWFGVNAKTLEIELRVFGPWHRQVETTADRLGDVHQARGEWMQEAKYRRVVIEARRALLGEGHYRTVDARLDLAEALAQPRRTAEQRQAVGRAIGLTRQAITLHGKRQTAKAVPLLKRALVLTKEALGEKHPHYAKSLQNLAFVFGEMGDDKQALPLLKQAVAIHKVALGEKHPDYAAALHTLAVRYQDMGDHKAALPLYKHVLAIRKEALGEEHPHYAASLATLAGLYRDMGDHKAALPLCQKHLQSIKEALGAKHPYYAAALHNLAVLYSDMGDYKAALSLHKQAVVITKEVLREKHTNYATSLNNLAVLYQKMGDHTSALPLFKQALAIRKAALGEKHPHYATSLAGLASLYKGMGDHKQALPLCQTAREVVKEALGEEHPIYATCLYTLAELYKDRGDHKAALPLFQKALLIYKGALGERHPHYTVTLGDLASLHQLMGDHKAALPLAEEAVTLALAHLRNSASVQSDRQQFAAADLVRAHLDRRLSLLDAGCYGHVLAFKGAVLMRQRQRRLFTSLSADPNTRQAAGDLQSVTRQIAAVSASSRPVRDQSERLTKEQERLQAKLALLSAEAKAAFKAEAFTPKALSQALPEGVVLVDFLFYTRYGGVYRDGSSNWVRHLVAFVSRKGKPTVRIDLGPAGKVEDTVRAWRTALVRAQAANRLGAELRKLMWSPLEKHLVGAKVVLISPDEALASVPFCALPGKKAGTYLIEEAPLAVVPVPQMLPEMLKPVDKSKRLKPSLLVVGNVDYARARAAAARADVEDLRGAPLGIRRDWGGLPATFAETAAVTKAFGGLFKGGTVTDLGKADASKARVRQALGKVRYAHLATHGFFAQEDIKSAAEPRASAGLFGREGVTGWHPLLLSGVVLAGANKEPKEGEEDGILTALEVSEMELPKLELVVLSACETGLGRSAGGEGLLGLQRAFAVAGARTVVASLWEVDDRATQALMGEFYRVAWDPDSIVSRAEALRRAQLSILKEGKRRGIGKKDEKLPKGETRLPPLYWAAFVLSGDWR